MLCAAWSFHATEPEGAASSRATAGPRASPALLGPDGRRAEATACSGPGVPQPACPDEGDLILVADLLHVAAIDLDQPLVLTGASRNTSLREQGLTMRVNLVYDGYSTYYYKLSTNAIKAKVETTDWYNESVRIVNSLHGVQLSFAQSGGVVLPDAKTILLTLLSGLVRLTLQRQCPKSFITLPDEPPITLQSQCPAH